MFSKSTMNYRVKFSLVIIIFSFSFIIQSLNAKVSLNRSTKNYLTIDIDISDEINIVDRVVDGVTYKKIELLDDKKNLKIQGNFPEVEYLKKTIIFAAPENSNPMAELIYRSSNISLDRNNLMPAQKEILSKQGGIGYYFDYVNPLNGTTVSDQNKKVFEIEKFGHENGLNIYKLNFFPLRINSSNADIITSIGLKVTYNDRGFKREAKKNNKNKPKNFFETNIINLNIASSNRFMAIDKDIKPTFLDNKTRWIKIEIVEPGMYKVTGDELSQLSSNIDLSSINLDFISVYSSAGEDLDLDIYEIDDMFHGAKEITRRVIDLNNNSIFDNEDYILFYATGISGWKREKEIEHFYNKFNSEAIYWIDLGLDLPMNGKGMSDLFEEGLNGSLEVDNFDRFQYRDDRIRLVYSYEIAHWYSYEIYANENKQFNFMLDDISSPTVLIDVFNDPIVRNGTNTNSETIEYVVNSDNSTMLVSSYDTPIHYEIDTDKFNENSSNYFSMKNRNHYGEGYSKYLRSFEIKYKGKIEPSTLNDNNFAFEPEEFGDYKFNLINSNNYDIYDVSDPLNVKFSRYNNTTNNSFTINDSLSLQAGFRYYFVSNIDGSDYLNVPQMDIYDNTNKETLHSLNENIDMVIITPNIFLDYMESAEGGQRLIDAHLSVNDTATFVHGKIKIVSIEDINLEFGRGYQEPTATRNLIKYAHTNWDTKYVLLVGDATYDWRNINNYLDRNLIYPSDFTDSDFIGSDMFYSKLSYGNIKEVAIGRFPVDNLTELSDMIDKTVDYLKNPNYSKVRVTALLVADDERNPDTGSWYIHEYKHITNMERTIVPTFPESYILKKVYLTEYPFELDAASGKYYKPKAAEEVVRTLNQGTSVFLYVGHGAATQIAHEVAFNSAYFEKVNNFNQYFLQMGAACSTGLFDRPDLTGFAEEMIKAKNRGSIGAINNTRSCYSDSNEDFMGSIFSNMFYEKNNKLAVGEAMRLAHNIEGPGNKIIGFMLMGDPAVRIFRDYEEIYNTDSAAVELTTLVLDTLNVSIVDNDTLDLDNINAILDVVISDSERRVAYFNEEQWTDARYDTIRYYLPGNQILSAKSSIVSGDGFSRFVLPKDLLYGNDKGKINLYAYSEDSNIELTGSVSSISIKADTTGLTDETPPKINILFNDFNYKQGDPIPQDPVIIIDIFDENGINASGGIGHSLLMEIDGDETELNNFFNYYLDDYQAGFCSYQIFGLSSGKHTIKASAWDTFNNYNEEVVTFTVSDSNGDDDSSIGNILNYPNPIKDDRGTNFTFTTINQSLIENIKISIFTINGRKINVIDNISPAPTNFQNIYWNGKDFDGDTPGNGVYFYKIEIKYSNGNKVSGIGKLFFAR